MPRLSKTEAEKGRDGLNGVRRILTALSGAIQAIHHVVDAFFRVIAALAKLLVLVAKLSEGLHHHLHAMGRGGFLKHGAPLGLEPAEGFFAGATGLYHDFLRLRGSRLARPSPDT